MDRERIAADLQHSRRLITMDEVADWLSVSKQRAYELARQEVIPVVRLGRQIRVNPERLEQWIQAGGSV
jgi:excisionase family DNA binding protein